MKKWGASLAMILITGWSLSLAQFYPHEDYIDYREDYRGQFHFSPRSEWMNDINGLDNSGHITIRILVDWGQLEVFSMGGIFSYSEQFPFTPVRDDLGLTADGEVRLVSMVLHEISRTW